MHTDEKDGKMILVRTVGGTVLHYDARCIADLHAMLKKAGDWVELGGADEQKPAKEGTVEAWGRSEANPAGGWYGLKKGLRGRFGVYYLRSWKSSGYVSLSTTRRTIECVPRERSAVEQSVAAGQPERSASSGAIVQKVDLKRELKHLYQPSSKEVLQVEVPTFQFLMIDGEGDPNTSRTYAEAVEALFSVSCTAKFMVKKGAQGIDYVVMPLEGLWWSDDMSAFIANDRSKWKWTMMIMQPHFVEAEVIQAAVVEAKRKRSLPAVNQLRLEKFTEGLVAQTLHVGPFSEEAATIKRVHDFIQMRSELAGKHHEVYLSDIRRTDPAKWKTIIRQPMA